ncbi:MAG: hypothetical protein D3908_14190 [Candidatus Electrothrix sp. AUS4]|nr:hypothetical protein [Candidatus Electrothrix sp. AUS4]
MQTHRSFLEKTKVALPLKEGASATIITKGDFLMKKKTAALSLIGSFFVLGLFATAYGSGGERGSRYEGERGSRYEYRRDGRYSDDDRYRDRR